MTVPKIILVSTLLTVGFVAASPAVACDMHGGGYGGFYGANWKPLSPRVSTLDPAMMDPAMMGSEAGMEGGSFLDLPRTAAPAPAPSAKPSFSTAASRASKAALKSAMARRTEAGKDEAESAAESTQVRTASLKTKTDSESTQVRTASLKTKTDSE